MSNARLREDCIACVARLTWSIVSAVSAASNAVQWMPASPGHANVTVAVAPLAEVASVCTCVVVSRSP